MTTVLINHEHPWLRVINPQSGEVVQFNGGRLIVEDDDPNRDVLMHEAATNPGISILTVDIRCDICGEVFTGGLAKANLNKHRKRTHPDAPPSDGTVALAKAGAQFACTICVPAQTFANEDELMSHNNAIHLAREEVADSD